MSATPKREFRCASCGHHQLVRVRPRGCPVCHAPSPERAPWGGDLLASRLEARGRVAVRA